LISISGLIVVHSDRTVAARLDLNQWNPVLKLRFVNRFAKDFRNLAEFRFHWGDLK
jgi:hypothetical protein